MVRELKRKPKNILCAMLCAKSRHCVHHNRAILADKQAFLRRSVDLLVHILTGKLDVLHICGAERYNSTKGDGLHLEFQGDFNDSCPKDSDGVSIASRSVSCWRLGSKQCKHRLGVPASMA